MIPYPHPAFNLARFKARLSKDIGQDDASYTLQCSAPRLISDVLASGDITDCDAAWSAYNSLVDMEASGGLTGEVDDYPYDRLDLSTLPAVLKALGIDASKPFLKGTATTILDLLDAINTRWGTFFDVSDLISVGLPDCTCSCDGDEGKIGVALEASPDSLLYFGQLTIYIVPSQTLAEALWHPYVPSLDLPALTVSP